MCYSNEDHVNNVRNDSKDEDDDDDDSDRLDVVGLDDRNAASPGRDDSLIVHDIAPTITALV